MSRRIFRDFDLNQAAPKWGSLFFLAQWVLYKPTTPSRGCTLRHCEYLLPPLLNFFSMMKRLVALFSLVLLAASATGYATDYPTVIGQAAAGRAPYNLVGQLFFASGASDFIGSGVVIRDRSILTAGHNLYDADNGWSTDLLFRRAAYGDTVRSENTGKRIYLLGGYRQSVSRYGSSSVRTFASDMGGVRFGAALAKGASAGWLAVPSLLTNASRFKIAIGYAAEEKHTGDYPMKVVPDRGFASTWGSFYESGGAYFEGGMSGGPVFVSGNNGRLYVAAVVVSGSKYPSARGGIRVIDSAASNFIWSYLR